MADDRGLVVLIGGRRAGVVTMNTQGRLALRYDEEYLATADPTPLSLSMPLVQRDHGDGPVRAFLWGLLPDNEQVLQRWARTYQVSAGNPFALLRHVGEDCAGAAQFVRPERVDALMAGKGEVQWLDEDQVAERLRLLRRDPTAWHTFDTGQFSLAGAQAKTALHYDPDTGRWGEPRAPYRPRTSSNPRSRGWTSTTSTSTCACAPPTCWACPAASSYVGTVRIRAGHRRRALRPAPVPGWHGHPHPPRRHVPGARSAAHEQVPERRRANPGADHRRASRAGVPRYGRDRRRRPVRRRLGLQLDHRWYRRPRQELLRTAGRRPGAPGPAVRHRQRPRRTTTCTYRGCAWP